MVAKRLTAPARFATARAMNMLRKNYHQGLVLPIALVTSGLSIYATWHLHTLKTDSPIVATRAQAAAWASHEAKAERCLPVSVDIEYNSQGFAAVTGTQGPWFATLRCNQTPAIWWRLALELIGPWAAMTWLARLWFSPTEQ